MPAVSANTGGSATGVVAKLGCSRASLGRRPLLFGFFQCFMNSAHSFLSLGRSFSSSRKRSASVASDRNASTKSNFSASGLGAGTAGTSGA